MWHDIPQLINPVAFALGPLEVRWYALMWLLAFGSVYGLLRWRISQGETSLSQIFLDDLFFNALLGALLGGRIGYVLFYNFEYYVSHPLQIIMPYDPVLGVWTGIAGMSYHGGLLGVVVAFLWSARKYGVSFWQVADFVVPAIGFGYFFGRIGNFLNAELVGRASAVPWAVDFGDSILRHPSQLYEAVSEGLVIFMILWLLRNRMHVPGVISALYVFLYGLARFIAEYYREPDAHIGFVWGGLTMGQLLSLAMIVGGFGAVLYLQRRALRS